METRIVKIGNSQGLIIPKKLLSSLGESKVVDIRATDGELVIKPIIETKARSNWEKQFAEAIANGFIPENETMDIENEFDKNEWTW